MIRGVNTNVLLLHDSFLGFRRELAYKAWQIKIADANCVPTADQSKAVRVGFPGVVWPLVETCIDDELLLLEDNFSIILVNGEFLGFDGLVVARPLDEEFLVGADCDFGCEDCHFDLHLHSFVGLGCLGRHYDLCFNLFIFYNYCIYPFNVSLTKTFILNL